MARHWDAYQELRATTAAAGHGDKGPATRCSAVHGTVTGATVRMEAWSAGVTANVVDYTAARTGVSWDTTLEVSEP